jgi:hypothetical protein
VMRVVCWLLGHRLIGPVCRILCPSVGMLSVRARRCSRCRGWIGGGV